MMRANPVIMPINVHPLAVVLGVVVAVTLIGLLVTYVRAGATMRGYGEIARDAEAIAKKLRAETFRDGDDLVISGYSGRYPAVVRFSYSENTPGLNIQMKAPANFTLSVGPKGARATEGRVLVKTTDDMFDARFATRTDQPTQARMFLTGKQAMAQLQKLCCSSKTFLTFSSGAMELSELVIPDTYMAKHVSDHLDSMAVMATALGAMPGADAVKITGYRRERSRVMQLAMAVLVVTGAIVVISAVQERNKPASVSAVVTQPESSGIALKDQEKIVDSERWRVAKVEDFNSDAVSWLRGQHSSDITGQFAGRFGGTDKALESAYVLVARDPKFGNERRVVLLDDGKPLFDAGYKSLAIAALISHDNFSSIHWKANTQAPPPDGDALLIVRDAADTGSGVVLYASGGKLATATPANYQSVVVQ